MSWRPEKDWNNPHSHELKDYQDGVRIIVANPLHYEFEAGADAMLKARDKAWRDTIQSLDSESDNSMWGNELFRSRILLLTLIPEESNK